MSSEILIDEDNKVANLFGLVFELPEVLRPVYEEFGIEITQRNGDESYRLPVPATYVVDTKGIIIESFIDPDYTKRMEPDIIIDVLKNL
jgi:peroxiredoxin